MVEVHRENLPLCVEPVPGSDKWGVRDITDFDAGFTDDRPAYTDVEETKSDAIQSAKDRSIYEVRPAVMIHSSEEADVDASVPVYIYQRTEYNWVFWNEEATDSEKNEALASVLGKPIDSPTWFNQE